MRLNQTQKNFRKQMAALKDEGYKFEDELYSTTRKKNKGKIFGVSSIILMLLLLYPLYGMAKSSFDFMTVTKHDRVVTYVSKMGEIDQSIMGNLHSLIQLDYFLNAELLTIYEEKIANDIQRANKIKAPKVMKDHKALLQEKYENILSLIFLLNMSSKVDSFDAKQINAALEDIHLLNIKSQIALTIGFEDVGIKYSISDDYQIRYEYKSYSN